MKKSLKSEFDRIYSIYHSRDYLDTDPIRFLYNYPDDADREIVGLIASCLAYGRVAQILNSVERVLKPMGCSPRTFLKGVGPTRLERFFGGFKHRFTSGAELVKLLLDVKKVLHEFGSLNACFMAGYKESDETVLPALSAFTERLSGERSYLLPDPLRGSACKRLNLYLRWMVRKDVIDPGGWQGIPASRLVIPLDVHIYKLSLNVGFTRRKSADMKTALEITESFRKICPEDPLKYDFALTRPGIIGGASSAVRGF